MGFIESCPPSVQYKLTKLPFLFVNGSSDRMHFFPGSGNNKKKLHCCRHIINPTKKSNLIKKQIQLGKRETARWTEPDIDCDRLPNNQQTGNEIGGEWWTQSNSHAESTFVLSKAMGENIHEWLNQSPWAGHVGGENKARGGWPVHLLYISSILGLITVGS